MWFPGGSTSHIVNNRHPQVKTWGASCIGGFGQNDGLGKLTHWGLTLLAEERPGTVRTARSAHFPGKTGGAAPCWLQTAHSHHILPPKLVILPKYL